LIRPLLASGVLLLGVLALPARAAQDTVLLYPPDLMLTTEEKVKAFAFLAGKGTSDNVSVNGVPGNPLEGETFLKGEVKLFPGFNLVHTLGKTVRLFFLQNARMEQLRISTGKEDEEMVFQAYRLHPALDDGCEGCHAVEGGKLAQKDQKEACYACHNDFSKAEDGKKVFLHDPVAKGECTGCHDPHYAARPKLQKPGKGCLECHDAFPSKGTVHRPVARGECTGCHSPHAGPAPKQLLRPGNALCLGCHESVHERHRSASVRGTLTEVPQDFPTEKGELGCLGCHVPHQSAEAHLVRGSRQDLCGSCHRL
jgi:predicted CXXCH cytochrome family protein